MEIPIAPGHIIRVPMRAQGPSASRDLDAVFDTGAAFLTIRTAVAENLGYDLQAPP